MARKHHMYITMHTPVPVREYSLALAFQKRAQVLGDTSVNTVI